MFGNPNDRYQMKNITLSTRRGGCSSQCTKDMKVSFHNIPAELVQAGGEVTVDALTSMCNKIRKTEEWPITWTQFQVSTLSTKGNFILVGLGRSFFVCCLAHRGSTVGFRLLQCSSDFVRHPEDLRVSVATRSCRVLIFASS